MIRVLQIVTYMGRGGLETMIMNYYRNIDRTKIQFDFKYYEAYTHNAFAWWGTKYADMLVDAPTNYIDSFCISHVHALYARF